MLTRRPCSAYRSNVRSVAVLLARGLARFDSHIRTRSAACPRWLLLAQLVAACAADPDASGQSAPGIPPPSVAADASASSAADAGIVPAASAPAAAVSSESSTRPRAGANDCGGVTYKAVAKELEVLVLFDNSASMLLPAVGGDCLGTGKLEDCFSSTGVTLWDVAVAELNQFVRDPKSAGVSLAIKYFGTECEPSSYAQPDLPLGKLPGHASAVGQSLGATLPIAETATRPALEGALAYARARAATPGHNARQIILLVTDGYPDEADCAGNTTDAAAQIAAMGSANTPTISTYVFVTVPGLALDPIARAGGTERALAAELKQVGALSAALSAVRDRELAALPCEYELPETYFTDVKDPGLVNLTRDGRPIGRVGSAADCATTTDGWYYDDAASPRRILTCAAACAGLKSAVMVDVQLKCPTVVLL